MRVTINSFDATDDTIAELKPLRQDRTARLVYRRLYGAWSRHRRPVQVAPGAVSRATGHFRVGHKNGRLARLRQAEIRNGSRITDEAVEQLKILKALDRLGIEHADNMSDTGFASLASLPASKAFHSTETRSATKD